MEQKSVNISVVVRSRPLTKTEQSRSNNQVRLHDNSVIEVIPKAQNQYPKVYQFDKVFQPDTTQADFYESAVSPILKDFIQGYNCSVFTYGQTGSGKSYSMYGPDSYLDQVQVKNATLNFESLPLVGAIPRVVDELFRILQVQQIDFQVRVSHVEVYNEDIYDLLQDDQQFKEPLKIYEERVSSQNSAQTANRKVLIQGVTEILVKSPQEIIQFIQKSNQNRRIAETKMNEHSSRSHSIFTIQLIQKSTEINQQSFQETEFVKISKLNLVDLAGSESISKSGVEAQSLRQQEASKINKSLLTLGRVINTLVENNGHIPYRESKLTRLLQDSLGGKTKTCIIATISTSDYNVEETVNTLEYMTRAKKIKNMPEITQRVNSKTVLKEYSSELKRLKELLEIQKEQQGGVFISSEEYQQYEEFISNRNDQIKELETQITSLTSEMDNVRQVLEQQSGKYKVLKQELNFATNQYQNRIEDMQVFQEKIDLGKQVEQQNIKTMQEMKAGIKQSITQIFGDNNLQSVQKDFKEQIIQSSTLLQNYQQFMLSQVNQIQAQITQDLNQQRNNLQLYLSEEFDSRLNKVAVQCDQFTAQLANIDIKQRQQQYSANISQFIQQIINTQVQEIQTAVLDSYQQQIDNIKASQNVYVTEQFEFKNVLNQVVDSLLRVQTAQNAQFVQQQQALRQLQDKLDQQQQQSSQNILEYVKSALQQHSTQQSSLVTSAMTQMSAEQAKLGSVTATEASNTKQEQTAFVQKMSQNQKQFMQISEQSKQQLVDAQNTLAVQLQALVDKHTSLQQHVSTQFENTVSKPVNQLLDLTSQKILTHKQDIVQFKNDQKTQILAQVDKTGANLKQNAEKGTVQIISGFKKQIQYKENGFEMLQNIEKECQKALQQIGEQVSTKMDDLYYFQLNSQLMNQSMKTPKIPHTPLQPVDFGNGLQTQQIFGVNRKQAPATPSFLK
ncbi:Kinesin-like_protein [Hexamita inflata]|uniref:Kinesin-like protein n=1 Tax=Hexamita inflata TaxID=28002 RepID=A0ABP1GF92_9EUKA